MKTILITAVVLFLMGCSSVNTIDVRTNNDDGQSSTLSSPLLEKKWSHGSLDCDTNSDPAIEVFRYDHSSYILRQNKCLSFEAPFIYVLFGDETALVLDTGATEEELDFPIYKTIQSINKKLSKSEGSPTRKILVIHSHSHGDHYAGDLQFLGKPVKCRTAI